MPAKVVLVTGCSAGGIGYALCQEFAARGCKVYATARSVQKMQGLEAAGCVLKALDVTNSKAISSVVSQVLAAEGRIDMLVNNAGMAGKGTVTDWPLDEARRMFETNYFSCAAMMQAVTPAMIEQRSGTIVNVGSIAAYCHTPFFGHYCATKAALKMLSDTARLELRPFGINVVFSAPGYIRTEIFSNVGQNSQIFCKPAGPYATFAKQIAHGALEEEFANATPVNKFAKGFAQAVLQQRPPLYQRGGYLSWIIPALSWYVPMALLDNIMYWRLGLAKWAASLRK